MDSFIDSTFELRDQETNLETEISKLKAEQETENCEKLDLTIAELFLDQETENHDETDIEISKLISAIGQEEKEKEGEQTQKEESNTPSTSPCALPLMLYLVEVSGILSSASRNPRSEDSDTEKSTDSKKHLEKKKETEFQSPTIGSRTEVDETPLSDRLEIISSSATLDRTPSNQQLGQVPSIVPIVKTPLVGQPQISLPAIPSLLVTVPLSQMPPGLLSLNLTPVSMPNRGTVPRVPTPSRTGTPPSLLLYQRQEMHQYVNNNNNNNLFAT